MCEADYTVPAGATTYNAGEDTNPWTELKIRVPAEAIDLAGDIAQMTVPYGIYIEDYRFLEEETLEIAHIDLIDEDLLQKDRSVGYIHIYLEPGINPMEAVLFLQERYSDCQIASDIELLPCKREDWQNNWKKYFHPMEIGSSLLIQPSWEEEDQDQRETADGRKILRIEPGMAFGTGSHDTTRLCLETLEETIQGGETVLDLGCGSGILSLAALLLGAKSAEGVDIDELAVKTAIENGTINGFTAPQYTIHCGDMAERISGTYDIVVANIVADIIVLFCQTARQFMHEESVFIISGIIATREEDVLKAFADNNFTVKERKQSGEWLCFTVS